MLLRNLLSWLTPVAVLLGFVAVWYWAVPIQPELAELHETIEHLRSWNEARPFLYGTGFLTASIVLMVLPFPLFMLAFIAGAIFDFWHAVLLVSIASTLGATLLMLASRYVLARHLWDRLPGYSRLNSTIERDGAMAFLSLRLVPGMPFYGLNIAAGLTSLNLRHFVLYTLIGKLPLIMVFAGAGAQLAEIEHVSDAMNAKVIALLTLLAVFPLLAMWASRQIRKVQAD